MIYDGFFEKNLFDNDYNTDPLSKNDVKWLLDDPMFEGVRMHKGLAFKMLSNGTYRVVKYTGDRTTIDIPEKFNGISVTRISDGAFSKCENLIGVNLPESIVYIGARAFEGCISLAEIQFPESLIYIDYGAFLDCYGLRNIYITENVHFIADNAFAFAGNVESITVSPLNEVYLAENNCLIEKESRLLVRGCKNSIIPSGGNVRRLGDYAFSGVKGLRSLRVPKAVEEIGCTYKGCKTFAYCPDLEELFLDGDVRRLSADIVNGDKNLTKAVFLGIIGFIEEGVFSYCDNLKEVVISEKNHRYKVVNNCVIDVENGLLIKGIGHCSLSKDVRLSAICREAFSGSLLTEAVIPEGVIAIGTYAFSNCRLLSKIILPESLERIGFSAFFGCKKLEKIIIPKNVVELGFDFIGDCPKLKMIEVEEGNALYKSSGNCLIDINEKILLKGFSDSVIPSDGSVTIIGSGAFENCVNLTRVDLPESVYKVERCSFYGCGALSFAGLLNVVEIEARAFSRCKELKEVIFGEKLNELGSEAFSHCHALITVRLPKSLNGIGYGVFADCVNLSDVYLYGSFDFPLQSLIGSDGVKSVKRVVVEGDYIGKNLFCDSALSSEIVLNDDVMSIKARAFSNCHNLKNITLSKNLAEIGDFAFEGCFSMENFDLPNSVGKMGKGVFSNCISLKGFYLPSKLTVVEDKTFYNCNSLKEIFIDDKIIEIGCSSFEKCRNLVPSGMKGVRQIGDNAFAGCNSIRMLNMPNCLLVLREGAFFECEKLKEIIVSDCISEIEKSTFSGCLDLEKAVLPEDMTRIGERAFAGCKRLSDITLPKYLMSLGKEAFAECESLVEIGFGRYAGEIGENAFSGCKNLKIFVFDTFLNEKKLENIDFSTIERIYLSEIVADTGEKLFPRFSKVESDRKGYVRLNAGGYNRLKTV